MSSAATIRDVTPAARWTINSLSLAIPLVVIALLSIPTKLPLGAWSDWLPHAIGLINTLTCVTLVAGGVAIWRRAVRLHAALMIASVTLGAIFLVCYVLYHVSHPSTRYGGEGWMRAVYLLLLLSHIAASLVVLPLVLRALFWAATRKFAAHRRITRWAYPIWLYVSVTGVMVYLMIRPYYNH